MNCDAFRSAWKKDSAAEALHDHFDTCSACQLWVDAELLDQMGGSLRPDRFTEQRIRAAVRSAARMPAPRRLWWWGAGLVAASVAAGWLVLVRAPQLPAGPVKPADQATKVSDADVETIFADQFAEQASGPDALLAMVDAHPDLAAVPDDAESLFDEETDDAGGWYFADVL